jgi:hypothetical protein
LQAIFADIGLERGHDFQHQATLAPGPWSKGLG